MRRTGRRGNARPKKRTGAQPKPPPVVPPPMNQPSSRAAAALRSAPAAALLLLAMPAAAQNEPPRAGEDWIVTIGAGPQFYSRYPGADSMKLAPWPIVDIRREGQPIGFEAADEGAGFTLLRSGDFSMGPSLQFVDRRRDRDVGVPIGNVGRAFELGGFAQYFVGDSIRIRGEARKAVSGHDGFVGDIGVDFIQGNPERLQFSIGPRVRLGDGDYMGTYFGVTPAQAARTGLPVYDPGGGVHSLGATGGVTYRFNPTWSLHSYARYDRLVGDAADSPLVRAYGARDQFGVGVGIGYSFRVPG